MLILINAERQQAAVGFEPTDNGFANRRLGPLGYAAKTSATLHAAGQFCKEIKKWLFLIQKVGLIEYI